MDDEDQNSYSDEEEDSFADDEEETGSATEETDNDAETETDQSGGSRNGANEEILISRTANRMGSGFKSARIAPTLAPQSTTPTLFKDSFEHWGKPDSRSDWEASKSYKESYGHGQHGTNGMNHDNLLPGKNGIHGNHVRQGGNVEPHGIHGSHGDIDGRSSGDGDVGARSSGDDDVVLTTEKPSDVVHHHHFHHEIGPDHPYFKHVWRKHLE